MSERQLTMFEMLDEETVPEGEREDRLARIAQRGSGFEGGRLRLRALVESNTAANFSQRSSYIEWLKDEFGAGGYSMDSGWYVDFGASGLKAAQLRKGREYTYTWKELLEMVSKIAMKPGFLTIDEAVEIDRIRIEYGGGLPTPLPRTKYPAEAKRITFDQAERAYNDLGRRFVWMELSEKLLPALMLITGTEERQGKRSLNLKDRFGNKSYCLEDDPYLYWTGMPTYAQRKEARESGH